MALTLAEGLVNAVVDYIEDNIAVKLAALDQEYDDGIALLEPVGTLKGLKSLKAVQDYPVLFVLSPGQAVRPWAVSGTQAQIESKPQVIAGILALDADQEKLQVRLYRYGRALVELMLDALGGASLSGWNLGTDEEWQVETETSQVGTQAEQSEAIGEVSLSMRANKIETK